VYSPCREWNDTSAYYREHGEEISPDHDPTDLSEAFKLALDTTEVHMGLFYKIDRPVYEDDVRSLVGAQSPFDLEGYLRRYR
jgi:hypothetical protein